SMVHVAQPGPGSNKTPTPSGACAPKQITATIPPGARIVDLAMSSLDEGWAVGEAYSLSSSGAPNAGLLMHYSHCHWQQEGPTFPNLLLNSVTMLSTTDGWASGSSGGYSSNPTQLLLHYSGGQWQRVTIPSSLGVKGFLRQVSAVAPDEVWFV